VDVCFVVATLNRPKGLSAALASVYSNAIQDVSCEIVVVDQGEEGGEVAKVCEQYGATYYHSKEKGLSLARNIGLAKSSSSHVAFLDDDAVLSPSFFSQLQKGFAKFRDVDGICGRILNDDDKATSFSRHQGAETKEVTESNFDIILSSALVIKREAIEIAGNFDEDFGVGARWGASEESDLVIRLLMHDMKLKYVPEIKVFHPRADFSGFTVREVASKCYHYGKGRGALLKKHRQLGVVRRTILLNFGPLAGVLVSLVTLRMSGFVRYLSSFWGRWVGFLSYRRV
jgi:GT2 family glycosyltransferase